MKVSLIAAMTKNRVIGKDNQMPWHLPADLKHFKQLTLHKPIVMGRKTFESIGRALPERRNIVVSRQRDLKITGVEVYPSMQVVLHELAHEAEVMIIGGQTLFEDMLAMASVMYLTIIDTAMAGDRFFPSWDEQVWQVVAKEKHAADKKNSYPYEFIEYQRQGCSLA